jgi:hypothetical protein
MSTSSGHGYSSGFEPAESWDALKYNLRILLDFACGSYHSANVDQSQIEVAAKLILLERPTGDKDWADAYKTIDYLTRIIGPATLEGITLEEEARRQECGRGFHISLPALALRRSKEGDPYLHGYRMETMRFCILTLFLLIAAVYAHSKIIPAQDLLGGIDAQSRETLKLVEKIALLEQSVASAAVSDRGVTTTVATTGDPPVSVPPSALRSQVSIQIATLQAEQRDRGVDVCFRHAYLKAWYLNHGLSSLASWIPFNRACDIAESEVLAACTGQATTISCHNGNLTMPPPSAETASALTSAGLEGIKPAAMGPRVPTASLEQASEHIIRAHVETIVRIWLPALYGALGACLWVIRERYAQIREVRVSRTRVVSRTSRLMLGAGMGSVVHMFQPLVPQGYEAVSLPAIAFVVGYNVEFVFALADEFIKRFAGNQPRV